MKKLFLRAEFGPLWEPWEEDEIGRKSIQGSSINIGPISEKVTCIPNINERENPENLEKPREKIILENSEGFFRYRKSEESVRYEK